MAWSLAQWRRVNDTRAASAKDLASSILDHLETIAPRPDVFSSCSGEDVTREVWTLKAALSAHKLNPAMIQPGHNRKGYRLALPARAVAITNQP